MPDTHISITEITLLAGKKKSFKLNVNGVDVKIPVDEAIFAHYQDQFVRKSPTEKQRQTFATLLSLMRSAYLKGSEDGKNLT